MGGWGEEGGLRGGEGWGEGRGGGRGGEGWGEKGEGREGGVGGWVG